MQRRWFWDLSHYKNLTDKQWDDAVENGLCGMITKGGQGLSMRDRLLPTHMKMAKKRSVPAGIFHWPDPSQKNHSQQVGFALDLVEESEAKFIVADVEQWWLDWGEWYQRYVLRRSNVHVRAIPSANLYDFYYRYLVELRSEANRRFPGMPVVLYSAPWFVNDYCRPLASLTGRVDYYWNARYFFWGDKDLNHDKKLSWEEFHAHLGRLEPSNKDLPRGVYEWDLWQVGTLPIDGYPVLDINIISDRAAERLFGDWTPAPKPEQPPAEEAAGSEYVVNVPVLNKRSSPKVLKTNDVGDLHEGDILDVADLEGKEIWLKLADGTFCCYRDSNGQYVQLKPK